MHPLTPLRLDPVLVAKPWGGRRLAAYGKALPPDALIGESWDVADLASAPGSAVDDPHSRVADGPLAGASLCELIERFGSALLGSASPTSDGRFPLLVKFLDAREHLSVQVHPHARYVAEHPDAVLKTESWYVVDATPGAQLFLDLVDGTSVARFRDALGSARVVDLLRRVPATAGDFHHLPAGIVHALGAGVLVAEVQTPSDTTFRVYDWTDEYGREPRDLHLRAAAETVVIAPDGAVSKGRHDAPGVRALVVTDHYWMREHVCASGAVDLVDLHEARVLLVTRGRVAVDGVPASAGAAIVVPADVARRTQVTAASGAGLLEVGLTPVEPARLAPA